MRRVALILIASTVVILMIILISKGCGGSKTDKSLSNATVTVVDEGAKEAGLDLQALGELVKKSPNPAKLEEALNTPGSINNLDINHDGQVDYVKVAEVGTNGTSSQLTFTDVLPDSSKTEIANIRIERPAPNSPQATMDINGNQAMYGDNYSYHSGFSVGEVLLMAYLFSPHVPYYSPYGYRYYPSYYHSYRPVPTVTYRRTVTTYNSHPTGGSIAAPSTPSRSLSNPSSSQRSFSTRDASKPVGSGGFGSRSSRNATSSGSSSSSSPSSSRSSSSGRSGFGSSRSSSSSSHSSSSSSHRSFGRGRH